MISSGIYVSLVFYTTFSIYHCSAFSFIFQSKIKQEQTFIPLFYAILY